MIRHMLETLALSAVFIACAALLYVAVYWLVWGELPRWR
jgi:hypothetical protein